MHLRLLLIASIRRLLGSPEAVYLKDVLRHNQGHILEDDVHRLTLRGLLDTTKNFQVLWPELIASEDPADLYRAVDACLLRFGALASGRHEAGELDCDDFVEVHSTGLRHVNNACVRTFTGFFYVAYCHVHLAACCLDLPPGEPLEFELHSHLVTTALDDYYALSMYYDATMASIMQYRHEFTGMFHSVSQVMYYNNPSYARRPQRSQDDILSGNYPDSTLPVVRQLYPDVALLQEDDPLPANFSIPGSTDEYDPAGPLPAAPSDWAWIVVPGCVYLACATGLLFHCPNIIPLLNLVHRHVSS
eukprot:2457578-Rhodomonas_salina.1